MIQPRTIIKAIDNSGVKSLRCIKVIGSSCKRWARYGELIKASAFDVHSKSKVKRGQVINAIIVRCIKPFKRPFELIKFNENAVVVLNEKLEPIGTRILGPILKELKYVNLKVFSIANNIL